MGWGSVAWAGLGVNGGATGRTWRFRLIVHVHVVIRVVAGGVVRVRETELIEQRAHGRRRVEERGPGWRARGLRELLVHLVVRVVQHRFGLQRWGGGGWGGVGWRGVAWRGLAYSTSDDAPQLHRTCAMAASMLVSASASDDAPQLHRTCAMAASRLVSASAAIADLSAAGVVIHPAWSSLDFTPTERHEKTGYGICMSDTKNKTPLALCLDHPGPFCFPAGCFRVP